MAGLKERSIRGLLWSAVESFGQVALSFVTFLVLAWLLQPKDFGLVALAGVFVFFLNYLGQQGFPDAIVQRPNLEAGHFDAAFWSGMAVSLALMGVCWAAAGWLGAQFEEPGLGVVLPWLALAVPLNALAGVPSGILRKALRFRDLALCSLGGRMAGAAVAITLALSGYGVWSLVGQQLVGTAGLALAVSATAGWRPRLRASTQHLRDLWRFGLRVSSSQIVIAMSEQALSFLIGMLLGTVVLGYFTIAWRMVEIFRSLIASALYNVGFSVFSRLQSDVVALRRAWLPATRISCLVGFPIGVGLAILAPQIVAILFGGKWAPSVPIAQLLALGMLTGFHGMFLTALYRAVGHAGWVLWLATVQLLVGTVGVVLLAPWGILAITALWVGRHFALLPVHLLLVRWVLGTTGLEVLKPAVQPLVASTAMAIVVAAIQWALVERVSAMVLVAIAVPAGAAVYGATVRLLFPKLMREAFDVVRIATARRS